MEENWYKLFAKKFKGKINNFFWYKYNENWYKLIKKLKVRLIKKFGEKNNKGRVIVLNKPIFFLTNFTYCLINWCIHIWYLV